MGYAPLAGTITRQSGGMRERMKIPTATTTSVDRTHPNNPPNDFGIV